MANTAAEGVPPWDFKDPVLHGVDWSQPNPLAGRDVPRDTSAAAVVVEQLARLAIHPSARHRAATVLTRLEPMRDGLVAFVDAQGRLLEGCFNHPRRYATHSEVILGTAYLLFALYSLKMGRVME